MGRLFRLFRAPFCYARLACWGIVSPRFERRQHEVHQAVVLDARGRVLLSLRGLLMGWELPGGHARSGESSEEALRREVREETGIEVEVEAHVGDYHRTGFRPHRARVHRCRARGGALRPSAETPRVAWFEPTDLPPGLFPWFRGPLADALARKPEVLERHERQGARHILAGLWIDLRTRWRGA